MTFIFLTLPGAKTVNHVSASCVTHVMAPCQARALPGMAAALRSCSLGAKLRSHRVQSTPRRTIQSAI